MDRKKIIIIAGIVLILAAVVLIIVFWPRSESGQTPINGNANNSAGQLPAGPGQLPPPDAARVEEDRSYSVGLKQLAFMFAERYGSYSNETKLSLAQDLQPLMTAKMFDFVGKSMAGGADSAEYEGFETKALAGDLVSINEGSGRAEIIVKTQRTSYLADNTPSTYYQDLNLKFVKAGGEWKVDFAKWQ